jgi:hypothetical protein
MTQRTARLPDGTEVQVAVEEQTATRSRRDLPDLQDLRQKEQEAEDAYQRTEDQIAAGEYRHKQNQRQARKRTLDDLKEARVQREMAEDSHRLVTEAREAVQAAYRSEQQAERGKTAAQHYRQAHEAAVKLAEQIEAAQAQAEEVKRHVRAGNAEARAGGYNTPAISQNKVMDVLDKFVPHLSEKVRPEVAVPYVHQPEIEISAVFGGIMADHGERPKGETTAPNANVPEPRSKADILADHIGRQPTADEVARANKVGPFKAARLIQDEQRAEGGTEPAQNPETISEWPVGQARRKSKGQPVDVGNAGLGVERGSAQEKVDAAAPKLEDDADE